MLFPDDRYYSEDHIWVIINDTEAILGLSAFAKAELSGINYIELNEENTAVEQGRPFGVVETSKAVVELIAPLSGVVRSVNRQVLDDPEEALEDVYGGGWLIKLTDVYGPILSELHTASDYRKLVLI